ncbi:protein-disulfide isomerase [Rhizobium sp. PP-F2F-G48]|uniref:DsbA family protein n=1 Tax=Rhizobium sp. PP-F2F-G48 TaxID=2135651 RepID=UPI001049FAEA|nr:thioredoxin domain-containing protein [Rhizobium sp. PP-F2F-G48]TCM46133.1 protein-disulfide isomerase [Rhizobium sp. PP-F2F-G48]
MNRRTLVIASASAAIAVFAGGAALYSGTKPVTIAAAPPPATGNETLVRMHSPVMGPVSAPVTIVEFFDPSCEACRAFYPLVKQLMAQTGPDVRLVLRYTAFHERSDDAVRILEVARRQNRFQPVLEALLEQQPVWADHGRPDIERAWQIAGTAGLDVAQGKRDAAAPAVDNVLAQDTADVQANNVTQTPTFFVNGKPLTDFSPQGLSDLVKTEIDATKGRS